MCSAKVVSQPSTAWLAHPYLPWLFFLFAAVLILAGTGLRSPWPADEPRFALIAKEMVESGQWLFPLRGGEYYPDKPPVFMWSIAVFYALTGSLKLAFLLPSALCSLLTLFLVYDLGSRLWNRQTGLVAAATLLFSFQFVLQAKSAQIDAMATCWITLGCYGMLRFMLTERRWRWYFTAFFFMGVGVITKGVGFLPVFMLIPYALYVFRFKQSGPTSLRDIGKWIAGPAIMLVTIGLWLVPMLLVVESSHDPLLQQYRDNILFRQTVTRYADSWHHIKPFWYYALNVIPAFWLPLSVALPWLVPNWTKALRAGDGRILIPLGWVLLVLIFFSISPGKRGVYILPALPMLALIASPYVTEIVKRNGFSRLITVIISALSLVLLTAGVAGLAGVDKLLTLQEKFEVTPWWWFILTGNCGLATLLLVRGKNTPLRWPVFMSLLWVSWSTWGYVLLENVKTPVNVYDNIRAHHGDNIEVGLVDFAEQFILFSPYPVTHFGFHTPTEKQLAKAYEWLEDNPSRFVLTSKNNLKGLCFDSEKAEPAGYAHRNEWVLLSSDSKLEQCTISAEGIPEYHYRPATR
ncbi:glycosyltransferase family 39 protein [Alteromonas sp. NFXS44]|uniref:ArnT family glycosyltransferase n=1 Tax=Alteromonas sp. NFXS44 TaxID=2818435 RepID=UPI0032DFFB0F